MKPNPLFGARKSTAGIALLAVLLYVFVGEQLCAQPQLAVGAHPGPSPVGCPDCTATIAKAFTGYPGKARVYIATNVDGMIRMAYMSVLNSAAGERTNSAITYCDRGGITPDAWESEIRSIRGPEDKPSIQRLHQMLIAGHEDKSSDIYFINQTSLRVSPETIGMSGATSVRSIDDLSESISRKLKLEAPRSPGFWRKAAVLTGIPYTPEHMRQVFQDHDEDPNKWSEARDTLNGGLAERKFKAIESHSIDKQKFLQALSEAELVVTIMAHAESLTIYFPGRAPFEISIDDIRSLNLVNSPFVLLRICESNIGDNEQIARAFLEAGAIGVNFNIGRIKADAANNDVFAFLDALKSSESIKQALDKTSFSNTNNYQFLAWLSHLVTEQTL